MSFENSFSVSKSVTLFQRFSKLLKTVGNSPKEAAKARAIDKRVTLASNYRCPIKKSSNWIPLNRHPCDRAPITRRIGPQRTNHDREFCYRYD